MDHSYLWLKTIHIVGVILFLGNIIITGWWKNLADRTKNPQVIAFAQRQVTLTDYFFTAGGSVMLFIAGALNVWLHGLSYSMKWLSHGLGFFILSALIWVVVLIPTQIKQAKMAKAFSVSGEIPEEYWRLCSRWNFWGVLAVITPLITVFFMVFKLM